LSRLSRIITWGAVELEHEALQRCAEVGIPITLLSASGQPQGFFLPWLPQRTRLHDLLADFLAQPHWRDRWTMWQYAMNRRAILASLARMGLRDEDPRESRARLALERAASRGKPVARVADTIRHLEALLTQRAAEALTAEGVRGEFLARHPDLDLIHAFAHILAWRYYNDLAEGLLPVEPEVHLQRRTAAGAFERLSTRESARLGRLLGRFRVWLGEQVDDRGDEFRR